MGVTIQDGQLEQEKLEVIPDLLGYLFDSESGPWGLHVRRMGYALFHEIQFDAT